MTGSRSKLTRRPLPIDDPVQRCPDITQATTVLGWQPKTDLKEGLAHTIEYFDRILAKHGEIAGSLSALAA
jgi:UDP-glucuronate decarboxylase